MDLRKLKTLIDLVSESNVAELEITEPEGKVRIVKSQGAQYTPGANSSGLTPMPIASIDLNATQPAPAVLPATQDASNAPSQASPVSSAAHVVKSPMVGTFYRSPAPGEPAFVEVGSRISAGQPVCILEAMKLMNELESEISGEVVEILLENGTPVEFGQVLMRIKPS